MNLKQFFISNKNKIKYTEAQEKIDGPIYKITGIGKKAIKYQVDGGEDEFMFFDHWLFDRIAKMFVKSFDNELWNPEIRIAIQKQKEYCKTNQAPLFAPEDGFCYSCGTQIYNEYDHDYVSNNLITGCPHCHKSYCD